VPAHLIFLVMMVVGFAVTLIFLLKYVRVIFGDIDQLDKGHHIRNNSK